MQITDPIADLLTRIRNASTAKHPSVEIPASNMKKAICQILVDEGYIKGMQIKNDTVQGTIVVTLKYQANGESVIAGLRRVSKPGLRIYTNCEDMPKVMKGLGTAIISTSKGIMTYPSFDLNAEVKNPQFLSMLRAGVPVQHAYEVVHMDQIKAGVAAMQAKATEKQVVDGIRAKGARPQENGTTSQGAFIVKDDVSKLSKRDRAEIIRRAARGEHIEF